jgi:hypothetical protein
MWHLQNDSFIRRPRDTCDLRKKTLISPPAKNNLVGHPRGTLRIAH